MHLFQCDYTGGCHPEILKALASTNSLPLPGYCEDVFCLEAERLILNACGLSEKNASVFWLSSGTLANLSVIDAFLSSNEAVICATTAHIAVAEAGAIEACGHPMILLPENDGKISAEQIEKVCKKYHGLSPIGRSHLSRPAGVYISFPTEKGTIYSRSELMEISDTCRRNNLFLYLDGARLAYGLASSDVTLKDIASLTDAFYIGGTKCGALIGEAVVIKNQNIRERYIGVLRMRGGLIAKGRLIGIAFKTFFAQNLYFEIGKKAVEQAQMLAKAFQAKGIKMASGSPTNQIFPVVDECLYKKLQKNFRTEEWGKTSDGKYILRFCTSWSTTDDDITSLLNFVQSID